MSVIPTKTIPTDKLPISNWLEEQLSDERPFLLAFADDGLIWGKKVEGKLVTSHDIIETISPELNEKTLQQAFVFGQNDEVRLFHDEMGGWKALVVTDGDDIISESQILWGQVIQSTFPHGFTHIRDDTRGTFEQLYPLEIKKLDKEKQCIRLDVHHLVDYDLESGEAYISLSRLVELRVGFQNEVAK